MADAAALNRFLASVERRAFRLAQFAVRDVDEAMDIVQDAMLVLVKRYADKPEAEWRPLFHRILQNRIMDSHRRRQVRERLFGRRPAVSDDPEDSLDQQIAAFDGDPERNLQMGVAAHRLESAVRELPMRQQQAFLLRVWEGLSVAETATAMRCSEGSVKTHYFRAVHTLREALEEHV